MKFSHITTLVPVLALAACATAPAPFVPELDQANQDRVVRGHVVRDPDYSPPAPRPVHGGGGGWSQGAPRLSIHLGQRSLDSDYEPVEDQVAFGLEFSQEFPSAPMGWELGFMGSYDEDDVAGFGDIESATAEIYGGLRKTIARPDSPVQPYVGGGLSLISVAYDAFGIDDDDSSIAAYAHAGVEIEVSPVMALGIDLRGLFGSDVELFGVDADADYTQLTVFLSLLL